MDGCQRVLSALPAGTFKSSRGSPYHPLMYDGITRESLLKIASALSVVAGPSELAQLATMATFVEEYWSSNDSFRAGLRLLVRLAEWTDFEPRTTSLQKVKSVGGMEAVRALQDAKVSSYDVTVVSCPPPPHPPYIRHHSHGSYQRLHDDFVC